MLKYFSQHLTKLFMSRDSFAKTTVTPKDPSSKIFNHFQNIIVSFLENIFILENTFFLTRHFNKKHTTQSNIINKMHDNNDIKFKI